MPERKKGDRKRATDLNKMERAEEDERKVIKKPISRKATASYEDPFFRKGDVTGNPKKFDDPILGKPDPSKFDDPILGTDKLDKIKKPTDDDLK